MQVQIGFDLVMNTVPPRQARVVTFEKQPTQDPSFNRDAEGLAGNPYFIGTDIPPASSGDERVHRVPGSTANASRICDRP